MKNIFFDSWESIIRTFVITILAYICLIFFLRLSGKRTLSKMNAFDFIVTVALGSCLATVSLNKNVALTDGALVFLILIFLQFLITTLSTRFEAVKYIVTNKPTLLVYKGEILYDVMKRERITKDELFAAARSNGVTQLEDLAVVVLETTGDITVIKKIEGENAEALSTVSNFPLKQAE